MLEAHLNVASFTCAGVGKRQNLPATLDGTNWFLLLGRVTITRLEVLLQDCLLVLSHMAGGLDGHGTCFANNNLSAVVVGFQARVGLVGSVFQTKHLALHCSHVSVVGHVTIYKHFLVIYNNNQGFIMIFLIKMHL